MTPRTSATLRWLLVGCTLIGPACAPPETTTTSSSSSSSPSPPVGGPVTPTEPGAADATCRASPPAEAPLRRLSSTQVHRALEDLFGADVAATLRAGSLFPPTPPGDGFEGDALANVVDTVESEAIEDNAARIAALFRADPLPTLRRWLPCPLPTTLPSSGPVDEHSPEGAALGAVLDACVDDAIAAVGARAYRRPVSADEQAVLSRLYATVRATQPALDAWAALVEFFVQAPAFLYRAERGAGPAQDGRVRLTSHEVATRLALLFTHAPPDDALRAAAADDALSSPEVLLAHARRLMDTPAFDDVVADFHRDWLQLYRLRNASKDPTLFPAFAAARADLLAETRQLGRFVLRDDDGLLRSLLGARHLPVSPATAPLYGVALDDDEAAAAAADDAWPVVAVPHRRGILSQAGVMAALAAADHTSPIHRGAFLLRRVLCEDIPALPPDVDTQGPLQDSATAPTARQRLAPLLERRDCRGCHSAINPLGLALENYDAAGAWRATENGAVIDAHGSVRLDGVEHAYRDAEELFGLLQDSPQVGACYARRWFEMSVGRPATPADACTLDGIQRAFTDSDGDLRTLFLAVVRSEAFVTRPAVED